MVLDLDVESRMKITCVFPDPLFIIVNNSVWYTFVICYNLSRIIYHRNKISSRSLSFRYRVKTKRGHFTVRYYILSIFTNLKYFQNAYRIYKTRNVFEMLPILDPALAKGFCWFNIDSRYLILLLFFVLRTSARSLLYYGHCRWPQM